MLKIDSWEFTIRLFRDEYRVPLLDPVLAAQAATIVELGVPPLLFAGLATRLATLPLLGMIAVIQVFVYPNAWSDHLMWAAALVFVLTRGPGAFSVDYWVAKGVATRRH
jgi:putative oxidoreductase